MTDKEIFQTIEEYSEEANALYERIHEQVEASIVKHAQAKKRRKKLLVGILSVAVALVVTLGIVLPTVLQPQDEEVWYSDVNVLLQDKLDCNLKEYYAINNLPLLYIDWYVDAEDLITERYYEDGKERETVYLYEKFTDGNTGRQVQITVMKQNIVVESLDERFEESETTTVDNTQIIYALYRDRGIAKFEYQGYKYYLELTYDIDFDFLVETIESMFNN